MNITTKKVIVIIVGAILIFFLTNFLPVGFHDTGVFYNNGWVLSYTVIAVTALLFGPVVGGAAGFLGVLIYCLSIGSRFGFVWIFWGPLLVITPFYGFYGFILGKLFKKIRIEQGDKYFLNKLGLFFLFSAGLSYIFEFSRVFFYTGFIIRATGIIMKSGIFNRSVLKDIFPILTRSIVFGVIGVLLVLIYYKVFKGNIPFLFKVKNISEVKQEKETNFTPIPSSNQDYITPSIPVSQDSNFCTKCGTKLGEGLSFCTECGNRIKND